MTNTFKVLIRFARYDGLIARLALITERRGYAIENLAVVQSTDDYFSMNLTMIGHVQKFDHVCQQIIKLVDVIDLTVVSEGEEKWSNEPVVNEQVPVGNNG